MTTDTVVKKLHEHGLRVTPQRVWIFDYLNRNHIHPDADNVYSGLYRDEKRMTRSTVYNTLQAFVRAGLAMEVKLDDGKIRYDGNTALHGHFRCTVCGEIYDFDVNKLDVGGLDGFRAVQRDVYFEGICKKCYNK